MAERSIALKDLLPTIGSSYKLFSTFWSSAFAFSFSAYYASNFAFPSPYTGSAILYFVSLISSPNESEHGIIPTSLHPYFLREYESN
tara:strand:+ start:274 stop:534 length:261 start_codon:yes stop_codon:yes gene_type:complete